ncbi:MAG: hypothetical protein D6714_10630 [Bacteroidetes bacterium]|nr:MAG: hypothetical protein D6714_10630 [Bacteroidota bacterium]
MDYKNMLPWIFIFFVLILVMMGAGNSRFLIGFGVIAAPLLLIWQAWMILTAKDVPTETFEDKWYEDE